ncbi:MAG: hypothetical protein SGJ11_08115 [Phycisphaerae bacterium]|nr:hypothetical protein [Phycisphaerae bacterium]
MRYLGMLLAFMFMSTSLLFGDPAAIPQAATGAAAKDTPAVDRQAIADALRPSLVIVEIRLKEDRGTLPQGFIRGRSGFSGYFARYIEEERPLELPGYLVAPQSVIVTDPELPARFISSIKVRSLAGTPSDARVDATPSQWLTEDRGMVLTLAASLPAPAKPLTFLADGAKPAPPLSAVQTGDSGGLWALRVTTFEERFALEFAGPGPIPIAGSTGDAIIVDSTGAVVRAELSGRRLASSTLSPNPAEWPHVSAAQMAEALKAVGQTINESILRTTLHFRSPRKGTPGSRGMFGSDDSQVATELEALSVVLADGNILVIASIPPAVTARLERIEVTDASNTSHEAEFVATLRDWGALIAKPKDPISTGIALSTSDLSELRNRLLLASSVRVIGRNRVSDPMHLRLGAFEPGWKGIRFPTGLSEEDTAFIFAPDNTLAALPIAKREQPGGRDRFRGGPDGGINATPASVIAATLATLATLDEAKDPTNIPLTEDEESRSGWLGVLMQPLEAELARANGMAEVSRDGEFGGLVTFVYPDSPAAKADIQPGDILLTVTTPRRDRPMEIAVGRDDLGYMGVFPWERLDELPEEYYDQIPAPWPPIGDTLNTTLTELGIGSTYSLEFGRDGETVTKALTVEQSPPHYGNAPKFEAKAMGMTVRDLTLEVRQYLNLGPDAPGVVVSKLEPGQRASVAGMRPFEIITQVDDQPITNAEEFGKAIEGKTDMKFAVKRAQKERVVKVSVEKGAGDTAAQPTEKPAE